MNENDHVRFITETHTNIFNMCAVHRALSQILNEWKD
jgi:hypothetical protein